MLKFYNLIIPQVKTYSYLKNNILLNILIMLDYSTMVYRIKKLHFTSL